MLASHADSASEAVCAGVAALIAKLNPGGQLSSGKAPGHGIRGVAIERHEISSVHVRFRGFGIQSLAFAGGRGWRIGGMVAEILVVKQDVFLTVFGDEVAGGNPSSFGGCDPVAQIFGES